jgi:hypothetical protein
VCYHSDSLVNPAESTRSYSSVFDNDQIGQKHARSMLDSAQAWSAKNNQVGEWMQLDLGRTMAVTHIVTQGRHEYDQWVTEYKVQHSTDGSQFTAVSATFTGNKDRGTYQTNALSVGARYIRIYPQKWSSHMSMRMGVHAVIPTPPPPPPPPPARVGRSLPSAPWALCMYSVYSATGALYFVYNVRHVLSYSARYSASPPNPYMQLLVQYRLYVPRVCHAGMHVPDCACVMA